MTPQTRNQIVRLTEERRSLMAKLSKNTSGSEWCRAHTEIADQVVRLVYGDIVASRSSVPPLSIVATGGYGRYEMAPYSDVDLTVIPSDEAHPDMDAIVRELFRDLHHAFGTDLRMDVGYAYTLINDASGLDAKTRTGYLDSRLVAGEIDPYNSLMDLYWESFAVGEFILNKIREREACLSKRQSTPLVVEPDLKEGAGGLRSFQCANWIREAIGERPTRPTKSYDRVLRARNVLHWASGKRQEQLTRHRQAEIAELLGVDMYEMMSELVEAGRDLHREYLHAKERLFEARFPLSEGVMAIKGEARVSGSTRMSEAAVGIAFATQLGIQVADIPAAANPGIEGPEILYAIGAGEAALRNIDRCGLLEQIMPELTRCRFLLPIDTSHEFTVFEHTMRVVRNIDLLKPGSFLGDLKEALHDTEALYLATLLHDIGKAKKESEHAELGEEMARQVCKRWRLAPEITDLVAWLVKNHLTMSIFIRMRDVVDPATAAEFAQIVNSQDRLDMLTILTYADTIAVADGAWSPAQMSFLRELHGRTTAILQGDMPQEVDASQYRR